MPIFQMRRLRLKGPGEYQSLELRSRLLFPTAILPGGESRASRPQFQGCWGHCPMSTGLGVQPHASWVTSSESFHYLDPQFLLSVFLLSVLEMSKYNQLSELPSTKQALYVCVLFFFFFLSFSFHLLSHWVVRSSFLYHNYFCSC